MSEPRTASGGLPKGASSPSPEPFIPAADPRAGMVARRADVLEAMARVLDGGRYILGDEVAAFERELAAWLRSADAVGVASGTDALELALRACGLGPGDEVITVSHTAVGTVAAIELAGATPVLADIDLETFTLDPAEAERAITPRTRAILPVHLYGQSADLGALQSLAARHGLLMIEDCAQSIGARFQGRRTGSFGDAAAFSFYPTKNLGAIGDGGAVVTSDPAVAERLRALREYGWHDRYVSDVPGLNSRLDELQAAILRVRFAGLEADNATREALATRYRRELEGAGVTLPVVRSDGSHVWHQFVIRHPRRDLLRERLRAHGVGTLVHYPVAVHQQPAYRGRLRLAGDMARTEEAAATVLSLPVYPELSAESASRVIAAVRAAAAESRA